MAAVFVAVAVLGFNTELFQGLMKTKSTTAVSRVCAQLETEATTLIDKYNQGKTTSGDINPMSKLLDSAGKNNCTGEKFSTLRSIYKTLVQAVSASQSVDAGINKTTTPMEDIISTVAQGSASYNVADYSFVSHGADAAVKKVVFAFESTGNGGEIAAAYLIGGGKTYNMQLSGSGYFGQLFVADNLDINLPKDSEIPLTVKVDLPPRYNGADSGDTFRFCLKEVSALSKAANVPVKTNIISGKAYSMFMHIYNSRPELALSVNSPSGSHTASVDDNIFRFNVVIPVGEGGIKIDEINLKLFSSGIFNTSSPVKFYLKGTGFAYMSGTISYISDSEATVELTPIDSVFGLPPSDPGVWEFSVVTDTTSLLNLTPGVDGVLDVVMEDLGTSSDGYLWAGDFIWEDYTNWGANTVVVKWLGDLGTYPVATLSGNKLIF